jgi:hypothetical protein
VAHAAPVAASDAGRMILLGAIFDLAPTLRPAVHAASKMHLATTIGFENNDAR